MYRFSNRVHLQQLAASLQPDLAFPAGRPEAWPEWRQRLRAKLDELLGGLPPAQGAPSAEVLDRQVGDGYVRERLAITGRDGVQIPAFLLTPTRPPWRPEGATPADENPVPPDPPGFIRRRPFHPDLSGGPFYASPADENATSPDPHPHSSGGPFPTSPLPEGARHRAVLCLHGHGRGKADLVGDPGQGTPDEVSAQLTRTAETNYDYALQYARLGFVTLAPDARGFGERAEGLENLESECYVPGVVSLLLGSPITGQRLCDDLSCLDYLCSLSAVDPARIGCAGLSEGGKRTMYLAAMDDRIRAAVISGYFTTITGWIRAWTTLEHHDICNYVPGLLRHADYPDLIALIAPRPLLVEYGTDDPLFDRPAVDEAIARAIRDYTAQGAADHFDTDIFAGGHQWRGGKSLAWLDRWL